MICATAFRTAIPPNKAPVSDPEPLAGRQRALRERIAGPSPEEKDVNDDRAIKVTCEDVGAKVIRASAAQSRPNEH